MQLCHGAHLDARIHLGRLLHEVGRLAEVEQIYREASDSDAIRLFNVGVLLDDMDRKADAVAIYEAALREDLDFADCHCNLAQLFEQLKKPQEAIKHMSRYRRLIARASE